MSFTRKSIQTPVETSNFKLKNQQLELHPYGGMFMPEHGILFVSDTHFGKVTHFRKNGIAVPMGAIDVNWERLDAMIRYFDCKELVVLGDLFHSSENVEWDLFSAFINAYDDVKFSLVIGNHDILDSEKYEEAGIEVMENMEISNLYFSHHPEECGEKYNIHGHIHPAVLLKGVGLGSQKIKCFYFGEKYGIMPAFGEFTGSAKVQVKEGDSVFLIVGEKVILADL